MTDIKSPSVSVIIPAYNGDDPLINCVVSVLKTSYPSFEIIVVDNASTDGSINRLREVPTEGHHLSIICNKKNVGFAKACNLGSINAKGKYLAFLNQDTIVDKEWIKEAVIVLEKSPEVGALQSKLMKMDDIKKIDSAGVLINIFGMGLQIGRGEVDRGQYGISRQVTSGLGAALFVRRKLFIKLNGFDSSLFVLGEDGDLCIRIWLAGYKVLYVPLSVVYHKGAMSRSKESSYFNYHQTLRNSFLLLIKNLSTPVLVFSLPISIILRVFRGIIMRYTRDYFTALSSSLVYLIRNYSFVCKKRKKVQSLRVCSDIYLLKQGILKFIDANVFINGF